MKFLTKKAAILSLIILIGTGACQKDIIENDNAPADIEIYNNDENGKIIVGQYIVVFKQGRIEKSALTGKNYTLRTEIMRKEYTKILSENNLPEQVMERAYSKVIDGFSAKLDDDQLEILNNDSRVDKIYPDRIVMLKKPGGNPNGPPEEQVVPWGITRVGGAASGVGKTAWVIDSGIDLDHPDLNVDVSRSVTFVIRTKNADDQNGHGTHVAGTIAALDNEIGVVGVAAGATVVPVRVLDRRGSGTISGVLSGVDYVGTNGSNGDVANMSLGGGAYDPLDDAVITASQSGVKFVLASGNESDDANYHSPARAEGPNIYTISAMDINDNWAYFSNYGTPVDYCAPGVNIHSTWKGGDYNTISGTSMAAPHAAGVLLLGAAHTDGTVNGDPDGNADPIIHR